MTMQNQNAFLMRDALISAGAACIAIATLALSMHAIHASSGLFMPVVASMGASTCLVFAVPHSPLAQPWPILGGHMFAALLGVACSQLIVNVNFAAATAVAASILVMHLFRCLHPPSAATALVAIFGGADIHALGWKFCYEVVAINVGIIVLLALIINRSVLNRRYPMGHSHYPNLPQQNQATHLAASYQKLTQQDFKWALTQIDGRVDVTEEDLMDLYALACSREAHDIKK